MYSLIQVLWMFFPLVAYASTSVSEYIINEFMQAYAYNDIHYFSLINAKKNCGRSLT